MKDFKRIRFGFTSIELGGIKQKRLGFLSRLTYDCICSICLVISPVKSPGRNLASSAL